MTPKEFTKEMRRFTVLYEGDREVTHALGDVLMMRVLRECGFKEGVDIFDAMEKWYA